jgi:hypothetical protein
MLKRGSQISSLWILKRMPARRLWFGLIASGLNRPVGNPNFPLRQSQNQSPVANAQRKLAGSGDSQDLLE